MFIKLCQKQQASVPSILLLELPIQCLTLGFLPLYLPGASGSSSSCLTQILLAIVTSFPHCVKLPCPWSLDCQPPSSTSPFPTSPAPGCSWQENFLPPWFYAQEKEGSVIGLVSVRSGFLPPALRVHLMCCSFSTTSTWGQGMGKGGGELLQGQAGTQSHMWGMVCVCVHLCGYLWTRGRRPCMHRDRGSVFCNLLSVRVRLCL